MKMNPVKFVSLGPGDPELITLKGLKNLQNADVVFSPATTLRNGNSSSRAKDILLQLGIEERKIILFDVPMSKDRTKAIYSYNQVSIHIEEAYKQGKCVAVTAEGDASFYSSIYYISEYLRIHNIPTERIAGIPAFIASGTLANIHIVKQEEELTVIPGIVSSEALINVLQKRGTVVIMKLSQCEESIKETINKMPEATYHYFENVGVATKEYYTTNQNEIVNRAFPYFSLLIIQYRD